MNTTFSEAFAAELETVERVVSVSDGEPGWGSDLSCANDLTEDCAELSGNDPTLVAQYTYRRLITKAGQLADDPDWGIDIEELLQKGFTPKEIVALKNTIRGEVARDDRLRDVSVDASYAFETESLRITVGATIVDSGEDFYLTAVFDGSGSNLIELIVNASAQSDTY